MDLEKAIEKAKSLKRIALEKYENLKNSEYEEIVTRSEPEDWWITSVIEYLEELQEIKDEVEEQAGSN